MNQADVIQRMQLVIDRIFVAPIVLSPSLSAKSVPEWDSLMNINLVVACEAEFKVRFRLGEVEQTKNVGEFADLICRHLAKNAGKLP